MQKLVLHIRKQFMQDDFTRKHLNLYPMIERLCADRGIETERRIRPPRYEAGLCFSDERGILEPDALHIIDHGSIRAPNVLNAALPYFNDFWHLDPMGIRAFHSAAQAVYDPEEIDFHAAQPFFQTLRRARVNPRLSRYGQPRGRRSLPQGAVAVFFQGDVPKRTGSTSFTDLEMLDTVLAHVTDRPVVVKPHPMVADYPLLQSLIKRAEGDPRLTLTDANVHDILRDCALTVSINSTVALEGFLHRKPAILFGKSDFHHMVGTVHQAADFPDIYARELARDKGFQKYIAWYFQTHCLDMTAPDIEAQVWAKLASMGLGQ